VLEAAPGTSYLGLRLTLDPSDIGAVVAGAEQAAPADAGCGRGLAVNELSAPLLELDAALRLVGRLETPRDIPVLSLFCMREIQYRLLTGEQSAL